MLFSKQTYIDRRNVLRQHVGHGLIILFGNNDSPVNYPSNGSKFRQDSSFLYYFGLQRDGLVGVIDADSGDEWLIGNDIDIEDIVWFGSVDSVADMAEQTGATKSAPMSRLESLIMDARDRGRQIHFLPPYRHDIMIQLMDLTGIHPRDQRAQASLRLVRAVVEQRIVKTPEEVAEIERACAIGYDADQDAFVSTFTAMSRDGQTLWGVRATGQA